MGLFARISQKISLSEYITRSPSKKNGGSLEWVISDNPSKTSGIVSAAIGAAAGMALSAINPYASVNQCIFIGTATAAMYYMDIRKRLFSRIAGIIRTPSTRQEWVKKLSLDSLTAMYSALIGGGSHYALAR